MKKTQSAPQRAKISNYFFLFHYVRILEEYESMYQEAIADVPKYLANPVNAYLLVKRLTSDWKKVEGVISKNAGSGTWILSSSFISFNFDVEILNSFSHSLYSKHHSAPQFTAFP